MPSLGGAPGYVAAFAGGASSFGGNGFSPYPMAPAVMPYRDGQPVDPLYRKESSSNTGLMVGGAVTWLVAYGVGLGYASSNDWQNGLKFTAVPVAGPFMAIGKRQFGCELDAQGALESGNLEGVDSMADACVGDAMGEVEAVAVLAVDGLIQALGATLVVVGLLDRDTVLVRRDVASFRVERSNHGYQLQMTQTF